MSDEALPAEVGSNVGLGAGARRWLALVEYSIVAGAWVCVYLALRTLAPPTIEWWQAGALGGTAMLEAAYADDVERAKRALRHAQMLRDACLAVAFLGLLALCVILATRCAP